MQEGKLWCYNWENLVLKNIGDLSESERKILKGIWDGNEPASALPQAVREELADLYSAIASQNPAGSAQSEFNQARARHLLGQGPNPGRSINEFSQRTGLLKFKRD